MVDLPPQRTVVVVAEPGHLEVQSAAQNVPDRVVVAAIVSGHFDVVSVAHKIDVQTTLTQQSCVQQDMLQ